MKIHFVYAGDPDDGRIQSPYCITKNLYHFLRSKADVAYYRWDDTCDVNVGPDDIFIGHPHYDPNTVVQKFFRSEQKCKLRCTIHPFHTGRPEDNMPFDWIAQKADKIFAICGPYWYDTAQSTCFASWKPKMLRLDMAVNANIFPFVRLNFHEPGQRRLTYIGSSMPQKNLGYMVKLMQAMPDVQLDWYGGDGGHPLARLPNVRTTGWVVLDREFASRICSECDIMINTSHSDANPTTLLEARAWGLITACTPQSGYYNDPFYTELDLGSIERSVGAIRKLLNAPTGELNLRAYESRREIETRYTWDKFCQAVWYGLNQY